MTRRHTPRITTFSYRGTYRYSWTLCTHGRNRVFLADDIVRPVLVHFQQAALAEGVAIIAYCFMPDHVHLLIEGLQERSSAVAFIDRGKQASGYWFKRRHAVRLWQKSSWDRVLRKEDDLWTVIRYILSNPVRAGLVDQPLAYLFSGSLVHSREELMEAFQRSGGPAG